jgi:DNA-directed RNA polymerase specialized sigma24 family protein
VVTGLVTRVKNGKGQAWDALVDRYAPLVWSDTGLEAAAAQDAAQNVWLKLVDQLDKIRDPAALPSWLATTTRRQCGGIQRTARRAEPPPLPGQATPPSGHHRADQRRHLHRHLSCMAGVNGKVIFALLCIPRQTAIQGSGLTRAVRMRRFP